MEDLKPQDFLLHCRTCLKKFQGDKYNIKELANSIPELLTLLNIKEANDFEDFYPDGICDFCYQKIINFQEFQNVCNQSNEFLQNLLDKFKLSITDVQLNQSLSDNEKVEDPLNFNEPNDSVKKTEQRVKKELSTKEDLIESETENVKNETVNVFFSTADNRTEIICKYGCGKTFRRAVTLKAHYRDKHETITQVVIDEKRKNLDSDTIKNFDFTEDEDYEYSEMENNKEDYKQFECKTCHKKFSTKSTLRIHMRLHQGELPFHCNKCERGFNKRIRLKRHIEELHGDRPLEIICKYGCGRVFNRYHNADEHYRKHRLNILDEEKTKQSPSCKKPKNNFKPNSIQDSFICEDCGQVFSNLTKLRLHGYKHRPLEERPYQCEQCNKGFIIKRSYDEHLLRHAGIQNFQCTICGKKKSTKRELRSHMNCHTKEKQVICTLCSKLFSDPKTMKSHIERVHQRLRKYNCRYCEMCFSKCDIRNRHELEHGAKRPLKCHYCDETFFLLSKLNAHTKTHNATTEIRDKSKITDVQMNNSNVI